MERGRATGQTVRSASSNRVLNAKLCSVRHWHRQCHAPHGWWPLASCPVCAGKPQIALAGDRCRLKNGVVRCGSETSRSEHAKDGEVDHVKVPIIESLVRYHRQNDDYLTVRDSISDTN